MRLTRSMPGRGAALAALLLAACVAAAQDRKPPAMPLGEAARHRFPQPVRVGNLIGRQVLEPMESQPVLGRVQRIVRRDDGSLHVVMSYGGVLGFGTHPIVVPVEAMVLLGEYMEVVDFTPAQLDAFPSDDGAAAAPLPDDATIRVGLAHPSH